MFTREDPNKKQVKLYYVYVEADAEFMVAVEDKQTARDAESLANDLIEGELNELLMENVVSSAVEITDMEKQLGPYTSKMWATSIPYGVNVGQRPCRVIIQQIQEEMKRKRIEAELDAKQLKFGFIEETPRESCLTEE